MAINKKLIQKTNTQFISNQESRDLLESCSTDFSIGKQETGDKWLNDIDQVLPCLYAENDNIYGYDLTVLNNYTKFKRDTKGNSNEKKLVYEIIPYRENDKIKKTISTGLYCGVINFKKEQLEIQASCSSLLFERMLNYCCGIYADSNSSDNATKTESIYSLLAQFMFLISLRKVSSLSIPKRYKYIKNRDYCINGNIDVESFLYNDLLRFDKKISYTYPQQLEIQDIIDTLYTAMRLCKLNNYKDKLPELKQFGIHLKELYSGARPSRIVINNIHKHSSLSNGLYSDYKRPIRCAQTLIKHNDLKSSGNNSSNAVSGYLVDVSLLWEMYLYHLISRYLVPEGWVISSQTCIKFYENAFFSKNNYPDFVLKHDTHGVYVIDAKFKKMNFNGKDVDNSDMQQINSYSYYFLSEYNEEFRGAALVYPSQDEKPNDVVSDEAIDILNKPRKFSVLTFNDFFKNNKNSYTIYDAELDFIQKLKNFLNINDY